MVGDHARFWVCWRLGICRLVGMAFGFGVYCWHCDFGVALICCWRGMVVVVVVWLFSVSLVGGISIF